MDEELSFEAVMTDVVKRHSELHFSYKGVFYWIAHFDKGSHISDENGNTQYFNNAQTLFQEATIRGKHLSEIWSEIEIDSLN